MKKTLLIFFSIILFLLISTNTAKASTAITYYYGDAIRVEDTNIEVVSDEITIDTTASKIENVVLLKNTTNQEIITNIAIPLENKEMSISINNLSIVINGTNVDYIRNENGEYLVRTKVPANSSKKLEISYTTDNDLKNAKIIKYNFENFANRTVGKVKVNMVIDEKTIPLIQKIYPGHYNFENNTISVEYYNYNVTKITKEFIVQKETFNNLLYGREVSLDDKEKKVISDWFNGVKGNYDDIETFEINETCKSIMEYEWVKDGQAFTPYNEPTNPLIYDMVNLREDSKELKGKTICVDFVETEDDKNLYVYREEDNKYILAPERDILKTDVELLYYGGKRGARVIYIGEGINGEDLNASQEEIAQYVNSINTDMYIRVEIYDDKMEPEDVANGMVGYYNEANKEIAKQFSIIKTYMNEGSFNEKSLRFLSNEYIANNLEVPNVVQFIGNRIEKDGKYVVNYFTFSGFYNSNERGLVTAGNALNTASAKKLIADNRAKNEKIKNDVENKISGLEFLEEEKLKEELTESETKNIESEKNSTKSLKLSKQDIFVFASIGGAILFCIIILIARGMRKTKE